MSGSSKEPVHLTRAGLRDARQKVLAFASEYLSEKNFDARSAIDEDLGLYDLDAIGFLEEFERRFGLPAPEETFAEPIALTRWEKHRWLRIMRTVLVVVLLPVWLPVFFLITSVMRVLGRGPVWKERMKVRRRRNHFRLTLGDLTVSLAAGRWVKRENIDIVFE